ncbi:Auxin efflux carrier family protein [Perilla frutescens var. hirtella]|uniref:Auxin efflux carrier family protein n=1 Tax=Perilla frutescens var. hirtella TaxID=608512 RepID=A0AAD4IU05_PERFH|nr:Auxin efflux carrier family protein [Perilla frutescens var. hirtella]
MALLLDLFTASSTPVVKVLLVTALGSYLAGDRVNILGDDARKHLNNIIFYVFNPALVSSNLAKTITVESMVELWFMPFNILITFILGSALGWVVIKLTKAPSHLRGLVIGCCAAGNLGNLLLIIIPAVCKERGSPFGDTDVCVKYGMAYASLSMAIGAIYLWSYVYNIVRVSSSRSSREVEIIDSPMHKSSREGSPSSSGKSLTDPLLSSSILIGTDDQESGLGQLQQEFKSKHQVSVTDKIKQRLDLIFKKMNLKKILAPSTTGAIVGFVVGLVPQLRGLLIGDAAPLHVILDTALLLGDGAIPAVTLIMGGNLLRGLKGSGIQKSVIFGVLAVRYLVMPLVGIAVVKGALRFGFVHNNPLYEFVLLLQFALPPAMNIGTITQLFGAGEMECSVIMLWCYSLASVALTLWSTLFLWLVSS